MLSKELPIPNSDVIPVSAGVHMFVDNYFKNVS